MGPFGMGPNVKNSEDVIVKIPGQEVGTKEKKKGWGKGSQLTLFPQVYIANFEQQLASLTYVRYCLNRKLPIFFHVVVNKRKYLPPPDVLPLVMVIFYLLFLFFFFYFFFFFLFLSPFSCLKPNQTEH